MRIPLWKLLFDLPPIWLSAFAVLVWQAGHFWPASFPMGQVVGWSLVGAGLGLMALAAVEMRRHRTTVIPHMLPAALVTTGVFRFTRNPIYLGDALVLTGLSILWSAPLGLALVPVFMFIITRRFILAEELRLRTSFGPAFDQWSLYTPRWLWPLE